MVCSTSDQCNNPGHNVKTTLIKKSVKVKVNSLPTEVWPLFLQGQMFVVHQIQHGLRCSWNPNVCGIGIVKVAGQEVV